MPTRIKKFNIKYRKVRINQRMHGQTILCNRSHNLGMRLPIFYNR
ncbi:hypothetical protein D3OALGB2SA_2810 [Olavius algarvensis associated proteobacterium Delta 3]|nr:hypothetical protein D3OALGB2SA_2810 [Olavius algarvensis associated proteobacterium Delta 3]